MEKIDRKFRFVATNPCNGKVYTEDNALILCAKDEAVIPAMIEYMAACRRLGADDNHIDSVKLLIERLREYQVQVECRVPDTTGNCELDRCIGGKGL